MSRAVIDQAGFRIFVIGLVISIFLGLALRAQIAPVRVRSLLQDSVGRLEKDFNIDFSSAEVVLSNWGLPLPYLQISNIRISPKKASCQDSQIFIQNLNLPISLSALVTSESLITEINASHVELRISELNHCFDNEIKTPVAATTAINSNNVVNDNHFRKTEPSGVGNERSTAEKKSVPSIFQTKTAALLQRINIDQIKLIYKKYPTQSIDFRKLRIDFGYEKDQLQRVDLSSQVYALKDLQNDVMYFKGELGAQIFAKNADHLEAILKLNGRLLDGEIQLFSLVNSIDKNIKIDIKASKVAIKPLVQLNLIDSTYLNVPMTFDFRGYGFYQYDTNQLTELKLSDIEIVGERTHISLSELAAKSEKTGFIIQPFTADIQRINLNKVLNLSRDKNIAQSIENLGEFTGNFQFKNPSDINVEGTWSGLEFIFANRGYRELQKIDSFKVQADLDGNHLKGKLNEFHINEKPIDGEASVSFNTSSGVAEAKAELKGALLNEKVWNLLAQVPQAPEIVVKWGFQRNREERHQLQLDISEVVTDGIKLKNLEINLLQTLQQGESSSLVASAKASSSEITPDDLKIKVLSQLFNPNSHLTEKSYVFDNFHVNLKGPDWRSMNFEFDSHLKSASDSKFTSIVRSKGEWSENDVLTGNLSLTEGSRTYRYKLLKDEKSELGFVEQ